MFNDVILLQTLQYKFFLKFTELLMIGLILLVIKFVIPAPEILLCIVAAVRFSNCTMIDL